MSMVLNDPWAILPQSLDDIHGLLNSHIEGKVDITAYQDDEQTNRDDQRGWRLDGDVAIVPMHGILGNRLGWLEMACGGCDTGVFTNALRDASNDPHVKAIVIDVDSPGGRITGTPEMADVIAEVASEMSVTAYSETMMCSAAYWAASAAGEVFVSSSAMVGSCGVILAMQDNSERWKMEGLKAEIFKSGTQKDAGRDGVPFTAEHRDYLQTQVDGIANTFKSWVKSHRPTVSDEVFKTAGTYIGKEVGALGLADGFCPTLDEMVSAVNQKVDTSLNL